MPHELSGEEKARAVLTRVGRIGNQVAEMAAEDAAELATIYDECVAPEAAMPERVRAVWERHLSREREKPKQSAFRNRRTSPVIESKK